MHSKSICYFAKLLCNRYHSLVLESFDVNGPVCLVREEGYMVVFDF